jgi:hypothetical protein
MGIMQFPTPIPMTNGNFPQFKFAVFTDGLSTVTTAGYLNQGNINSATPLSNADVIAVLYSFNIQTQTGTFGIFTVNIAASNGQITLTQWADTGNVLLPVVSGDVASFNGTSGQIQDSGIAVTNLMKLNTANVLTAAGSITLNKVNGTETANAMTANGIAGLITTSSLTTAGGASYAITWTNSAITATSVVLLTLAGGTNTTENITLKCAPGAGSATLTIYNNTAATALNGTIFMSYLVM